MMDHAQRARKLMEGLRAGDLAGRVSHIVEIDRHVPKIGPDAVVIAFSCDSHEVAFDLARFIFLGDTKHIDVDFTEIPDSSMKYWVYVEFERKDIRSSIKSVLDDASRLCGNRKWVLWLRDGRRVDFDPAGINADLTDHDPAERDDPARRNDVGNLRKVAYGSGDVLGEAMARAGWHIRLDEQAAARARMIGARLSVPDVEIRGPFILVWHGDEAEVYMEEA